MAVDGTVDVPDSIANAKSRDYPLLVADRQPFKVRVVMLIEGRDTIVDTLICLPDGRAGKSKKKLLRSVTQNALLMWTGLHSYAMIACHIKKTGCDYLGRYQLTLKFSVRKSLG